MSTSDSDCSSDDSDASSMDWDSDGTSSTSSQDTEREEDAVHQHNLLYEGAELTVSDCYAMLLCYSLRHGLSQKALSDRIKLIN